MLKWFYPRILGVIKLLIKRITAGLLCLTILFSFTACGKKEPKNANKKMNYILANEPKTLDPQIATDSAAVIAVGALYEGLARLDSNYHAYSGAAEKWESNADSTVFTFTLRSGAKWSDKEKTPVTANDFVFAFRRALAPQTGSTTCSQMFCIKNAKEVNSGALAAEQLGVTAKDANTLVVQLNYSYPDFPVLTAATVFMPCNQKFFESTCGRYGLERKYILGNGPFEIDGYGWDHGKFINMARSDTYSGVKKPLPSNLKLTIAGKETDVSDPVALLTKGTTDAIEIPVDKVEPTTAAGCTVVSFEDTTWGLCFNTQTEIMKNKNIRKAFIQAFDRAAVTKHLPKNINLAENIIPPSAVWMSKSYRSLASGDSFYLKQDKNAAALLTAGLNELSLPKLPIISVICPDNPNVKLMLNEMIATWNTKFNYYFNMEPLSDEKLSARVKSGNYQIALCAIRPDSDDPLSTLALFKSDSKKNPAQLRDPSFDAMLTDAEQQSGSNSVPTFVAAEKYLNEQGVFYPLYYEKHYHATAKGVTGVIFLPYGEGVDFIQAGKE